MGIEPRDLGALEKAVNDAAGRASNLWISFVFFATLIAITTGTVTHKHLFLELPLKLPVLNVDLPLMGYFFAVPLFFVVFHFYMLLQLDGLAAKIEDYNAVLREQHPHAADRRRLRQRLDSFIFAQVLVGARDRREGRIGRLNRAVAWITMVGLPIGTLLLLQLMFLPYHHQGMTWWHRICVVVDVGLVWFFWGRVGGLEDAAPAVEQRPPPVGNGALAAMRTIPIPRAIQRIGARSAAGMRWAVARMAILASAAVVLFATLVAVYPTELIYMKWISLLLPGSNRLVLADTDLGVEEKLVAFAKTREALAPAAKDKAVDEAKSAPAKVTLSLRGRDLSYANLFRTDLRQVDLWSANMRGVDLYGAQLQDANLREAKLQGATLFQAQLQGADLSQALLQNANLRGAQLQGANLSEAQLQGANLIEAQLQGANLIEAQLQGAELIEAQLQGADLSQAQLQGAKLHGAQLQDADLTEAQLQGADLSRAQLQGENFSLAQLQGADLTRAQLQGADLTRAQLQGADLTEAQLQGADLTGAQLQGADLSEAQLQGADLTGAQLQGADLNEAQLQGAKLTLANVYRTSCPLPARVASERCLYGAGASVADARHVDLSKSLQPETDDTEDWTKPAVGEADDAAVFPKFVDNIVQKVPAEAAKQRVKERLSVLEPGARTPEQDAQLASRWQEERAWTLSPSWRAHIIARLACGADGAPHVARGLLGNGRLSETGHHLHDIAAQMRAGKTNRSICAGVTGFDDEDWQNLKALVAEVPPKPDAEQSGSGK